MSGNNDVRPEDVERLYDKLRREAEAGGYRLNPDGKMTRELVKGLLVNEERYGYRACPCRLASGEKTEDLDIICPCDYRDPDLTEYGGCYCSLYVSQEVVDGKQKIGSIPERRPPSDKRIKTEIETPKAENFSLPLPVWRCRVCGYLCARESPPEVCPICKAKQERFEQFM